MPERIAGGIGGILLRAHLLTARRRTKANAAPVAALWADADAAAESFLASRRAEEFNRWLLLAVDADRSGWDLSQLLRPPGTRNRKYEGAPAVTLFELDDGTSYHPRELELALPAVEEPAPLADGIPYRYPGHASDLSRLSARMRALISGGNAALPDGYASRSEADRA